MTKNKIIIIIGAILVVIIGVVIFTGKKSKTQGNTVIENKEIETSYDNETGLYYIKDEETNEIITASQNEEDLKFYEENPEYNPNPLATKRTDLSSYINYEYENEVE